MKSVLEKGWDNTSSCARASQGALVSRATRHSENRFKRYKNSVILCLTKHCYQLRLRRWTSAASALIVLRLCHGFEPDTCSSFLPQPSDYATQYWINYFTRIPLLFLVLLFLLTTSLLYCCCYYFFKYKLLEFFFYVYMVYMLCGATFIRIFPCHIRKKCILYTPTYCFEFHFVVLNALYCKSHFFNSIKNAF